MPNFVKAEPLLIFRTKSGPTGVRKQVTFLKLVLFKANHLAYKEPSWYWSRISADCQQK